MNVVVLVLLRSLITRHYGSRPTPESLPSHPFFSSLPISTLNFLDRSNFTAKTREEKISFMKGLTSVLDRFSDGLRTRKILPSLLEEVGSSKCGLGTGSENLSEISCRWKIPNYCHIYSLTYSSYPNPFRHLNSRPRYYLASNHFFPFESLLRTCWRYSTISRCCRTRLTKMYFANVRQKSTLRHNHLPPLCRCAAPGIQCIGIWTCCGV